MEGDCVYTLSGHTSFVYSISVLPNGDIISGGEDRTVRVWRGQSGRIPPGLQMELTKAICCAHGTCRRRVHADIGPPRYLGLDSVNDAERRYCNRLQRRCCARLQRSRREMGTCRPVEGLRRPRRRASAPSAADRGRQEGRSAGP